MHHVKVMQSDQIYLNHNSILKRKNKYGKDAFYSMSLEGECIEFEHRISFTTNLFFIYPR